jgi:hypothetical protein
MQLYCAYGLTVASGRPLPFAPCPDGEASPDVTFLFEERSTATVASDGGDRRELSSTEAGWSVLYANAAGGWMRFEHDAAARTLRVTASVASDIVEMALIGVVCALLLSRQGRTLLHGAAVSADGGALAILGDSGRGKSTLGAALLQAGARLISEDLIVTETGGDAVRVHSGYDRISLLPDAMAALGVDPGEARVRPGRGLEKFWLPAGALGGMAPSGSPPLTAIYILAAPDPQSQASAAHPVSPRIAAIELVRHLYGAPWMRPVSPADLAYCAAVAARVPVFRLARPASLAAIGETARMLLGNGP